MPFFCVVLAITPSLSFREKRKRGRGCGVKFRTRTNPSQAKTHTDFPAPTASFRCRKCRKISKCLFPRQSACRRSQNAGQHATRRNAADEHQQHLITSPHRTFDAGLFHGRHSFIIQGGRVWFRLKQNLMPLVRVIVEVEILFATVIEFQTQDVAV